MFTLKNFVLGTAATTALATAASADFLGFDGNVSQVGDFTVIKMHAVFSNNTDIALNLFEMEVVTQDNGGFNQSDVQIGAGGTWAPNASLDIPGFADSAIDSYATIGYGVGPDAATNGTALDPTFLDATGGLGAFVPSGSGWYNGNPTNTQTGSTYAGGEDGISGFSVVVGQFVVESSRVGFGDWFIFDGEIGFADPEVQFGGDVFTYGIPAPGALALLGLGGVASRRRRK
ncbi:MAG: hypothetical protein CBC35_07905 [Planctomycetes bacterium TMED75]|nr:hypothetical protein [Planctomycetaceae bacterium]OUU92122.1 MAG: hypothetical protein CBC35_07905 [Planctomycetes bacterium TMED75]